MSHLLEAVAIAEPIVVAFVVVAMVMVAAALASGNATGGRIHASAIAIAIGLGLAYAGGVTTGGQKGIADLPGLAGIAIFGYRDAVSMTTIGAGAATYIVGPVTGTALGASGEVIALSIATGVVKSIACMVLTPVFARWIGLNNPRAAMVYGGLLGTTSGVAAGLAAVDAKLVPYGALTATFYTGLGCLVGPSLAYLIVSSVTR
jgi:hypothetical protein